MGGALAGLFSQAAVLAAVLFYFGWVRTKATYGYFGVDISVLNFSVADYVLHSASTAFPLLVGIGVAGLLGMILHETLRRGAGSADQLGLGAVTAGAGLAVAGLVLGLALHGPGEPDFVGPCIMLVGSAVAAYGLAIRHKYGTRNGSGFLVAAGVAALLAFLWFVTAYANYIGIRTAEDVRSGLRSAPAVTVYSSADLSLSGPGITKSRIQGPSTEYRYRYSGLRMLVSSGGQYFLLPSGWRRGHGSVIVLPVTGDGNIRVEFSVPAP